jgi:hypothetical protein
MILFADTLAFHAILSHNSETSANSLNACYRMLLVLNNFTWES